MDGWIRSLSDRGEFALVLALGFGWPIYYSLSAALSGQPPAPISNAGLVGLLMVEVPILAVIAVILALRGWTPGRLGPAPGWRDLGAGLVLTIATALMFWLLQALVIGLGFNLPSVEQSVPIDGDLSWPVMLSTSLVNGLYEEALVCGYLITALRDKRSMWAAIHLSTAIRIAYHLYQGSAGVISIVPMGLAYAWLYARTGRLWPLVLAHVLLDVWALAAAG
ncbi:CPBP family intramembrane glutamic endopeptidase [Lysobacter sp. TAB13]|uniref:CPBP family intramembrane glutamic endopeptidase n=1 Tax=Lysobacter sp. TAB13 TaxID=3233065 RepID=UPI003F9CCA2A